LESVPYIRRDTLETLIKKTLHQFGFFARGTVS
jgi:hypothetical protein